MISKISPEEEFPTQGQNAPLPSPAAPSKKRVLLVDDEECITTLCQIALERTGQFVVRVENESSHAVAAALEFSPDLIILDWHMPDKEGTELAADLRAESALQFTPMVFLTGAISREEAEEQNARGGFETITKPIDRHDFVNRALALVQATVA